jgi:uncharacterized membrane protein
MRSLKSVKIASKFKNYIGILRIMNVNIKTIGFGLIILAVILGLILIVVKINFDSQAVVLCDMVHDDPTMEMSSCPAHTSSTPWLLMVAFGITFLVFGGGVYLIIIQQIKSGLKPESMKRAVNLNDFTDEEKKIYELLHSKNGSMYQSEIVQLSGWSKVKVTRMLDHLEHDKKILERKRRGMANIVVLK